MTSSGAGMRSLRDGPLDSLEWGEGNTGLELRAKDGVLACFQRDVVASGDGSFEFKKIRGWLRPVYSAKSSLHSFPDSPVIFRYTGSIWSQFKEKWSLEFKNGKSYEWRVVGPGKWAITSKADETTLVRYESPVNYLDFHWTPQPEGKVFITEESRGRPETPLVVYWGLYLIRNYRLQLLYYQGNVP